MVRITDSEEAAVLSFFREQDRDLVLAAFNLSPDAVTVTLGEHPPAPGGVDVLTGTDVDLGSRSSSPAGATSWSPADGYFLSSSLPSRLRMPS